MVDVHRDPDAVDLGGLCPGLDLADDQLRNRFNPDNFVNVGWCNTSVCRVVIEALYTLWFVRESEIHRARRTYTESMTATRF
jgi:hypothetical protein